MSTVLCETCGSDIPQEDIDAGEALSFEGAVYCIDCKEEIIPIIRRSEEKAEKAAKRKPFPKPGAKKTRPEAKAKGAAPAAIKKAKKPKTKAADGGDQEADEEGGKKKHVHLPKKKPFPVIPVAIAAGAVVLLVVLAVAFGGRGPKPMTMEERRAAMRKTREDSGGKLLAEVRAFRQANPEAEVLVVRRLNALMRAEVLDGTPLEEEARKFLDEVTSAYQEKAAKAWAETEAKVKEAMKASRYDEAMGMLAAFPAQWRLSSAWRDEGEPAQRRIREEADARGILDVVGAEAAKRAKSHLAAQAWGLTRAFPLEAYQENLPELAASVAAQLKAYEEAVMDADLFLDKEKKAQAEFEITKGIVDIRLGENNLRRALKELRKFPADLMDTETGRKLQAWIDELDAKWQEIERRRWANAHFEEVLGDDLLNWTIRHPHPQAGDWRIEMRDGAPVLVCNEPGQGGSIIGTPGYQWRDFVLELDFKVQRGATFHVAARIVSQAGQVAFIQVKIPEDKYPPGDWHRLRMKVDGDEITEVNAEGNTIGPLEHDTEPIEGGGIGFQLEGGGVEIKDIQIKVPKE